MKKLNEVSFCGIDFGHIKWHSHINKCDICKLNIDIIKSEYEFLKNNWNKKCQCGCGTITKFESDYIVGHWFKNIKQTEEHKNKRLESWYDNGNSEICSKRFIENNPSKSEKNRKRLRENNPAKNEDVRKKISENNPMNIQKNIDKIKETKFNRYGDENYNNPEKFKETFLEKYGVDNPAKVKEILERRIESYCNNLSNGLIANKNNWKCGYYIRNNGEKEWYDSSYELIKMKEYDEKELNWTKKHGIKIPFIKSDGLKSFYVPDFLIRIDDLKLIIEVKGWLKKDDIIKAKAAIEWCAKNNYEYNFLLGKDFILTNELSYFKSIQI